MNTTENTEKKTLSKHGLYYDDFEIMKTQYPGRVFVFMTYVHQYTEGITGANRSNIVITGPDNDGFATVKEAREYIRAHKARGEFKSVLVRKSPGYGNIGTFYGSPSFVKGKAAQSFRSSNYMDNCGYRAFNK